MKPTSYKSVLSIILIAANAFNIATAADVNATAMPSNEKKDPELKIIDMNGKFLTNPIIDADNTLVCTIIPKKDVEDAIAEQKKAELVGVGAVQSVDAEKKPVDLTTGTNAAPKDPATVKKDIANSSAMPADSKAASTDAPVSGVDSKAATSGNSSSSAEAATLSNNSSTTAPPLTSDGISSATDSKAKDKVDKEKEKSSDAAAVTTPAAQGNTSTAGGSDVPASSNDQKPGGNLISATDSKDPKLTNIPPDGVAAKIEPSQSTNNEVTPLSSSTTEPVKIKDSTSPPPKDAFATDPVAQNGLAASSTEAPKDQAGNAKDKDTAVSKDKDSALTTDAPKDKDVAVITDANKDKNAAVSTDAQKDKDAALTTDAQKDKKDPKPLTEAPKEPVAGVATGDNTNSNAISTGSTTPGTASVSDAVKDKAAPVDIAAKDAAVSTSATTTASNGQVDTTSQLAASNATSDPAKLAAVQTDVSAADLNAKINNSAVRKAVEAFKKILTKKSQNTTESNVTV